MMITKKQQRSICEMANERNKMVLIQKVGNMGVPNSVY